MCVCGEREDPVKINFFGGHCGGPEGRATKDFFVQ